MQNLQLNPITFPIWWYSTGLRIAWHWFLDQASYGLRQTSLLFFLRHINEPFYKDYTRTGRFLGYFFRTIMVLIKAVIFLLRLLLSAFLFAAYIAALPAVVLLIIYQLLPTK